MGGGGGTVCIFSLKQFFELAIVLQIKYFPISNPQTLRYADCSGRLTSVVSCDKYILRISQALMPRDVKNLINVTKCN